MSGKSSATISTGVRRVLLHPVEDLEAAPAAVAPERVGAVGDVLELVEDEARHDQGAVDEAGLGDLGDPAVDDRAGVDDDVGVARPARLVVRLGPAEEAERLGRGGQVLPLGDRSARPCPAPGRGRPPAAATGRAARAGSTAGCPRSMPINRPMRRPTTAVTNSAVESAWVWRTIHWAGTIGEVGQDREADHDPGHDPGRQEEPVVGAAPVEDRAERGGQPEPDDPTQSGAEDADVPDHRGRCAPARGRGTAGPMAARAVSLASPGRRVSASSAAPIASRRVATATTSSPSIAGEAPESGRARDHGPDEPETGRLAQATLETRDAAQLAEQAHLADGDRPAPTGRSRSEEARARASGRSRPGSSRLRPPARLA